MTRRACLVVDDDVAVGNAVTRMIRKLFVQSWPKDSLDVVITVHSLGDGLFSLGELMMMQPGYKILLVTDYELGTELGSGLIGIIQGYRLEQRCFPLMMSGTPRDKLEADPLLKELLAAGRVLTKPVEPKDFAKFLPQLAEFWELPVPHTST